MPWSPRMSLPVQWQESTSLTGGRPSAVNKTPRIILYSCGNKEELRFYEIPGNSYRVKKGHGCNYTNVISVTIYTREKWGSFNSI